MQFRFVAVAIAAIASCILPAPVKASDQSVIYGRGYRARSLPTFDKGYLLFTNHFDGIEVWGPDGKLVFQTEIANPPGAHIATMAVDTDGAVALGIGYPGGLYGHQGGIAFLDRSGKELRFIETGRYMPAHVCFDARHDLWTFGWQRDKLLPERADSEDYDMFRKYSPEGKQLASYVSRSLFPKPGLDPGGAYGGLWRLRVSNDRVGAMANSGNTSSVPEWIEFGLDGQSIRHWKLGRVAPGGIAFTSAGVLYRQSSASGHPQVKWFDRDAQLWKTVTDVSPTGEDGRSLGILLGAEGEYLVFGTDHGGDQLVLSRLLAH